MKFLFISKLQFILLLLFCMVVSSSWASSRYMDDYVFTKGKILGYYVDYDYSPMVERHYRTFSKFDDVDFSIGPIVIPGVRYRLDYFYDLKEVPTDCLKALERSWILPADCALPSHCGTSRYEAVENSWWGRQWGYCMADLNCNDTDSYFKYCSGLPDYRRVYRPVEDVSVLFKQVMGRHKGRILPIRFALTSTNLPYFIRDGSYCLYTELCGAQPVPHINGSNICYSLPKRCNRCVDTLDEFREAFQTVTLSLITVADYDEECYNINCDPIPLLHDMVICRGNFNCIHNFGKPVYTPSQFRRNLCKEIQATATNPFLLIFRSLLHLSFTIIKELFRGLWSTLTLVVFPMLNEATGYSFDFLVSILFDTFIFECAFIFALIYIRERDVLASTIYFVISLIFILYVYNKLD